MTTQLTVVNLVLNHLGRLAVSAISDSDGSRLIAQKLTILIPELLLKTDWNWAAQLYSSGSPLTQNPFAADQTYTYCYQLPADYGRMDRTSLTLNYRIIDNYLLCNELPIQYYYTANNADYSTWGTLFTRALSFYCASELAPSMTNNVQLSEFLKAEYKDILADAILQNDMDRQIVTMPRNDFDRTQYV